MSTKTTFQTPPPSLRGYRFPDPPRRIRKPAKIWDGSVLRPINLNKEIFSKEPLEQIATVDNNDNAWLDVSLAMLLSDETGKQ